MRSSGGAPHAVFTGPASGVVNNVGASLLYGSAIIKSFEEIIQDLVLFEGSGIMKFSGAQNNKMQKLLTKFTFT